MPIKWSIESGNTVNCVDLIWLITRGRTQRNAKKAGSFLCFNDGESDNTKRKPSFFYLGACEQLAFQVKDQLRTELCKSTDINLMLLFSYPLYILLPYMSISFGHNH